MSGNSRQEGNGCNEAFEAVTFEAVLHLPGNEIHFLQDLVVVVNFVFEVVF